MRFAFAFRWTTPIQKLFGCDFILTGRADKDKPLVVKTVGFENDQPGVYKRVDDGWWGIASSDQDRVAQESQGLIYDRTKEHLGASDEGVTHVARDDQRIHRCRAPGE